MVVSGNYGGRRPPAQHRMQPCRAGNAARTAYMRRDCRHKLYGNILKHSCWICRPQIVRSSQKNEKIQAWHGIVLAVRGFTGRQPCTRRGQRDRASAGAARRGPGGARQTGSRHGAHRTGRCSRRAAVGAGSKGKGVGTMILTQRRRDAETRRE